MSDPAQLLVEHLDIWTGAIERKNGAGRGNGGRLSLYGVEKLRAFILDLAVRGKLVQQNPDDDPASELLKQIVAEKKRLSRSGETKRTEAFEHIEIDNEPFPIPRNWRWVRLSDILTKLTDGTHHSPPNSSTGDFLYITAKNIKNDGVSLDDVTFVSQEVHGEIYARCNPTPGDILYIKDGATTGVATINNLDEPFSMLSSVALLKLPSCIFNRLIVEFLRSSFFYDQMRGFMKGAAITRVTLKRMGPALLPLPPLAEQKRIVAKVDELMALCDALEAGTRESIATHEKLVRELLATLVNSKEADDLAANWSRIEANFDTLFTTEESIDALKRTILELTVTGGFLHRPVSDKESQNIGSFRKLQNGYAFKSEWYVDTGVRLLRNANISHGNLVWEDVKHVADEVASEFERFRLNEGDIVLTMDRPFISSGTKVARMTSKDLPSLLLQRVGRFQEIRSGLLDDYLYIWIESPVFSAQIDPGRSNGVPHISSSQVEAAKIFVPGLDEQRYCVRVACTMLTLLEEHKRGIQQSKNLEASMADALVTVA